jgi:hypothetical protein
VFSEALISARKGLGFKSALAFYKILRSRGAIDCDYSYYTRVEKGTMFPSPQVTTSIIDYFEDQSIRDTLVKAYCSEQFPKYRRLFASETAFAHPIALSPPLTLKKQKTLSMRQVACIAKSEAHYFGYLIVVLSRYPVEVLKLKAVLKSVAGAPVEQAIGDLVDAKVLYQVEEKLDSYAKETLFPPRSSQSDLDAIYQKMTAWDHHFADVVGLRTLNRKTYTRRISPRALPLIKSFAEAFVQLIESSDDSDEDRNSIVVHFGQSICFGELLG